MLPRISHLAFLMTLPVLALACVPEDSEQPGEDPEFSDSETDSDALSDLPEAYVSAGAEPDPERWDKDLPVVLPPWWKCGDSVVDPWEECDDGALNKPHKDCTPLCREAECGDGYQHVDEECDLGPANGQNLGVYGSCSETCEIATGCGDGVVQSPLEECDHGDGGSQTCSPMCEWFGRLVFVTAESYPGVEIGGLAGADGLCQDSAQDAGLTNYASFRAWLSVMDEQYPDDLSQTPAERLKPDAENDTFMRPDGIKVAMNVDDLMDGTLLAPIRITAAGEDVGEVSVWSNTAVGGAYASPNDCEDWTSSAGYGRRGFSSASDPSWTNGGAKVGCTSFLHLYCYEQLDDGNGDGN